MNAGLTFRDIFRNLEYILLGYLLFRRGMMFIFNRIQPISKSIATLITLLILIQPLTAQTTKSDWEKSKDDWGKKKESTDFKQICDIAEDDARADEGNAIGYGAGGFLCGIFGWLVAELSSPRTPSARLIGKDLNYSTAYTTCYEKKAKSIRRTSACTGWVIGSTVSIILIYAGK
ncbi:MAG: hypothetical protein HW421_2192 [Ignavibacteria bacterium]|nr:hypothetical protein [Ignavibacteria bacterium]